jgi:hypothetical protein
MRLLHATDNKKIIKDMLPLVEKAINSFYTRFHLYIPNEVFADRSQHWEILDGKYKDYKTNERKYATSMSKRRKKQTQKRQKFEIGDSVWLDSRAINHTSTNFFLSKFIGPYRIEAATSPVFFCINHSIAPKL